MYIYICIYMYTYECTTLRRVLVSKAYVCIYLCVGIASPTSVDIFLKILGCSYIFVSQCIILCSYPRYSNIVLHITLHAKMFLYA